MNESLQRHHYFTSPHLLLAHDPRVDGGDEDDAGHHRQHRRPHVVSHRPPSHLAKELVGHLVGRLAHLAREGHVEAADSSDQARDHKGQDQGFQHPQEKLSWKRT